MRGRPHVTPQRPRLPKRLREPRNSSFSSGQSYVLTKSTTPERLLLHDTYYPGWTAELDGKPTAILRTDQLFLAVDVPAGNHL